MGSLKFPQKIVWISLLVAGVGSVAAWSLSGRQEGLDVYGQVPGFSMIERSGREFRQADLQGKVWVANFIYTHCPDTCPFQNAELLKVQADLAGEKDFRIVSISIDPELDTPEVLSRFADTLGAHPDRWLFLTGEKRAIYRLAQEGFRLSVVDPREEARDPVSLLRFIQPREAWAHHPGPIQLFAHSSRFVLVDRRGRIRGYYHSDEAEDLERLRQDAFVLLRGK